MTSKEAILKAEPNPVNPGVNLQCMIEKKYFDKAIAILKEIKRLKSCQFPDALYIKNEMGDLADQCLKELGEGYE